MTDSHDTPAGTPREDLSEADRILAGRFVDGELPAKERAAFEARLAEDAALQAAVDGQADLSAMFVPGPAPQPSAGFRARVLAAARRLPDSEELSASQSSGHQAPVVSLATQRAHIEAFCRRLLVAAALLILFGGLAWAGILRQADSGQLEASRDEIQQEMERLDALIREPR